MNVPCSCPEPDERAIHLPRTRPPPPEGMMNVHVSLALLATRAPGMTVRANLEECHYASRIGRESPGPAEGHRARAAGRTPGAQGHHGAVWLRGRGVPRAPGLRRG